MPPRSNRPGYLPRLPREHYQGDAIVHWTLTTQDRHPIPLNENFDAQFRELLLHVAAREGLLCPVYCLMPDHAHWVWMGLRPESDQLRGMAFLRTHLKPALAPACLQHQPHDTVLRESEREHNAFARVCAYILANPVRAAMVDRPDAWRFNGAVIPGYPKLHPLDTGFWEKFWRRYRQVRHPDAGRIRRPAF